MQQWLTKVKDNQTLWAPQSLPQWEAVLSPADILGYGGAAGGGKSDLLLGLAATLHKRSVIFRRVFPNLRALIERSREIFDPQGKQHEKDSFNEGLHRWRLDDKIIEFEACQHEKDKEKQRGRPRDFYGFDEATEFSRSIIEFITAWLRSTDPQQRCRVVLTFNPPMSIDGTWIIDFFLPWIAYLYPDHFQHPNPAKPGELRWFAMIDGVEKEFTTGDTIEHDGETIQPLSRAFIPARLEDNPFLRDTPYRSVLQSMPEPFRSQLLHGDFSSAQEGDPWQAIPTAWIIDAQARWRADGRPTDEDSAPLPDTCIGADIARGGKDKTVLAPRCNAWFEILQSYSAKVTHNGATAAAKIIEALGGACSLNDDQTKIMGADGFDDTPVNVDIIGIGTSAYDTAKAAGVNVIPVNFASATDKTDKGKRFKMRNVRAAAWWKMREDLDPTSGLAIALPPSASLRADLAAPKWKITTGGILIESKDDIKKRLGRSPDEGDAVVLANWNAQGLKPAGIITDPPNTLRIKRRSKLWQRS